MTLPFQPITGTWGQPVYLIGGGPSLKGFDFSRLNGLTVGINKAAWLLSTDVFFTLDQTLVRQCYQQIKQYVEDGGIAYLAMPANEDRHQAIEGAHYVIRDRGGGLHTDPNRINGVNSGFGALGLAYHKRAPEIGLLGFDMMRGSKTETHWHDGYKWHNPANHKYFDKWASNFDKAAVQCREANISVTNFVGPMGSKVTAFPAKSLEDL